METLSSLFSSLTPFIFLRETLYNIHQFRHALERQVSLVPEAMIITPFYIDSGYIYELYAFELDIQIVAGTHVCSYRNQLQQIKLSISYDEVNSYQKSLLNYADYLLTSSALQQEIRNRFISFSSEKLFLEPYFFHKGMD